MQKIVLVLFALCAWCSARAAERLVVVANSDSEPLVGATVLTRAGIIAGMTDSYAIAVYEDLYIPKGWRDAKL